MCSNYSLRNDGSRRKNRSTVGVYKIYDALVSSLTPIHLGNYVSLFSLLFSTARSLDVNKNQFFGWIFFSRFLGSFFFFSSLSLYLIFIKVRIPLFARCVAIFVESLGRGPFNGYVVSTMIIWCRPIDKRSSFSHSHAVSSCIFKDFFGKIRHKSV